MNYNLEALYSMAKTFDFIVDTRGIYPTMIKGQKAAKYTTHKDAINFVSVSWYYVNGDWSIKENK